MSMFFVNTDSKSNAGVSYHDEWFKRGVAVTSGPEIFQKRLERPAPGDLILMYVNGIGIVGVGKVTSSDSLRTKSTISPNEPHEYQRKVDWYLDLRSDPVIPSTIKQIIGQTPIQTVQRVGKCEHEFAEYLDNLSEVKANTGGKRRLRNNDNVEKGEVPCGINQESASTSVDGSKNYMQREFAGVLVEHGISLDKQAVYLMRHADKRYPDLHRYIGTRALTLYQSCQDKNYKNGDLIVAFFGNRPRHGLLLGVWRVEGRMLSSEALEQGYLDEGFEPQENLAKYFYDLRELSLLDDLRLKLEIKWGRELAWHRTLKPDNSYPSIIRAECPVPFEGLNRVSLVMAELKIAIDDVVWMQELGGICGIYLITDERDGQHYVGSASGKLGILQRWRDYVATGHGGNQQLIELLYENGSRVNDFRFTLLEPIPLGTSKRDAIHRENYWKRAIGSKVYGLNAN